MRTHDQITTKAKKSLLLTLTSALSVGLMVQATEAMDVNNNNNWDRNPYGNNAGIPRQGETFVDYSDPALVQEQFELEARFRRQREDETLARSLQQGAAVPKSRPDNADASIALAISIEEEERRSNELESKSRALAISLQEQEQKGPTKDDLAKLAWALNLQIQREGAPIPRELDNGKYKEAGVLMSFLKSRIESHNKKHPNNKIDKDQNESISLAFIEHFFMHTLRINLEQAKLLTLKMLEGF